MFGDDTTAWSESIPQAPSDSTDSRGTADTSPAPQDLSSPNPNMGARGGADFIANASSIDTLSSISSPTVLTMLSPAVPSTSGAAAVAISGSQDQPTTAFTTTGDTSNTSPAPAGVGTASVLDAMSNAMSPASGDATTIANASVTASPSGAGSTAPVISGNDHIDHLGISADQFAPSPSLASVKQMLGPIQVLAASGSGSPGAVSPAMLGPTLGPIPGGPLDAAFAAAPPKDSGIAPVHPDDASEPKRSDAVSAVAPTIKAASADAQSIPSLVESGAKAILLSAHDGTVAAKSAIGLPGPNPVIASAPATTAPSIAPDLLATRDQLASAMATANPTAAAITTPPTQAVPAPLVPTLGADTHTLHMHGG